MMKSYLLSAAMFAASLASAQQVVTQQAEKIVAPRPTGPTALLFNFAINASGFDTEITISNTSADTSASGMQAGTCTISYFGSGAIAPQTSQTVQAGKQLVFTLSHGGGGIASAPGFLGYLTANCTFRLGRGSARVFAPNNASIATAYDAEILTLPRSTASPSRFLFPFVTSQAGYDTGFAIANTSLDPFGTVPAAGQCTLNFFGNSPPLPLVTPVISAGVTYVNLASSMAPGFQGYVMASCNFPHAAAYAFVADLGLRNIFRSEVPERLILPRDPTPRPLLFPWVSDQNGDTSIAIANTTSDVFGTPPAAGACTLNFFGANAPAPAVTPSIGPGSVYTALLSSMAPNFSGYVTANCSFAHARPFSMHVPIQLFDRADGDSVPSEILVTPRDTSPISLLFSNVSGRNGSNTSIVISNTTADPFGTSPAGGPCTISYFGDMPGGAPPPPPQLSSSILPGQQLTFSLSAGNAAQGIAGAPGFKGYVIADCGFPLARGVSETLTLPDLTATKSNNVSGAVTLPNGWTWTVKVENRVGAPAFFASGRTILIDNLPNSNVVYGTPSILSPTNVTGTINCSIASNTLTCVAGTIVFLGAGDSAGSFQVQFTATPSGTGTFGNPPQGGTCAVDPNNFTLESNEGNNACSDTVTVYDAVIPPSGGTVTGDVFGSRAKVIVPPGVFSSPVQIGLDVQLVDPNMTLPPGFLGPGSYFVTVNFNPQPPMPLPAPGLTIVLPLISPRTPGDRLDLFRVDSATGLLVESLDSTGKPIIGTVDPGGTSVTFTGVVHFSVVVALVPNTVTVALDIKPGDSPNSINPKSKGVIPVGILSTATFSAPASVRVSSLKFGRTGTEASLKSCATEDLNGDRLPDLICHFETEDTHFQPGDTVGILTGKTVSNLYIRGTDSIRTVPK